MTAKTTMILVSAALLLGAGPATVAEDGAQMRVSPDGMRELAMEKRLNRIATFANYRNNADLEDET